MPPNQEKNQLAARIQQFLAEAGSSDKKKQAMIGQGRVQSRYRTVIDHVYKEHAQAILDKTNSVYITDKNSQRLLIAYMEEGIYAADLNAQRELIRLLFLELFGEQLDAVEIYISRGAYKNNHPFTSSTQSSKSSQPLKRALTEEERVEVKRLAETIEDATLRANVEKAMTACLEWKEASMEGESE